MHVEAEKPKACLRILHGWDRGRRMGRWAESKRGLAGQRAGWGCGSSVTQSYSSSRKIVLGTVWTMVVVGRVGLIGSEDR